MLRCEPVVDAEHAVSAAVGQDAAQIVVAVEIPEHPTSTVKEHEQTEIVSSAWPIEPRRDTTGVQILRVVNRFRGWT